ncbi:hypothetical protein HDU86_005558 [Geranomyces michiganensis]|nr:hypothetical protein HDU86_005558 [Geranomyces michiganensis]
MSTRHERMGDKAAADRNTRILKELMMRPDNRRCADCRKKDPRWASWNLGVFFCIRCSGHHRNMGTHISKVKSADLDSWTEEQLQNMARWGNYKAAQYWEHDLPENFTPPESTIDQFIRAKYDRKQYAAKGPIPDPDTLKPLDTASSPTAANATGGATARTSPPMARLTKQGSSSTALNAPPTQASFANFAAPPAGGASAASAATATAAAATPAPAVQSTADQLLDIFSGNPAPGQQQQQPQPSAQTAGNLKNSILSLYGNTSSSQQSSPMNAQPPAFGGGGGGGAGGGGAFGSFAAFAQPSPYQQQQQQQPLQQQQQQSSNLLGGGFGSSGPQFQPMLAPSSFSAFSTPPPRQQQQQQQPFGQMGFGGASTTMMQPLPPQQGNQALSPQNNVSPTAAAGGGGIPDFAGFSSGFGGGGGGASSLSTVPPPPVDKATEEWGAFH